MKITLMTQIFLCNNADIFLLQDNTKHYFLCLESSIKLSAFQGLNCDLKYKLEIFLFPLHTKY